MSVSPWAVSADINFDKTVADFGLTPIDQALIDEIERVTGRPVHRFLRRGLFCVHRDLNIILEQYKAGNKPYIYTGRGPSSESMTIAHLIPFMFAKYLQEAFDAEVIIQLTDDEKTLFKDVTVEEAMGFGFHNALDIWACGFDPAKTTLFSNLEDMSPELYQTIVKIEKRISLNTVRHTFGFDDNCNIGQIAFCARQIAPAMS